MLKIKDLRNYLDELGETWDDDSTAYLGEYEDQLVYCQKEKGTISRAKVTYSDELGIIFVPETN